VEKIAPKLATFVFFEKRPKAQLAKLCPIWSPWLLEAPLSYASYTLPMTADGLTKKPTFFISY
jgi:hypothetical protein